MNNKYIAIISANKDLTMDCSILIVDNTIGKATSTGHKMRQK